MSLHRGKCFSMSVTVKMGNAKNEFEWYSDLGDSKKLIEINSLVGIPKVFKAWDFLKKHICSISLEVAST